MLRIRQIPIAVTAKTRRTTHFARKSPINLSDQSPAFWPIQAFWVVWQYVFVSDFLGDFAYNGEPYRPSILYSYKLIVRVQQLLRFLQRGQPAAKGRPIPCQLQHALDSIYFEKDTKPNFFPHAWSVMSQVKIIFKVVSCLVIKKSENKMQRVALQVIFATQTVCEIEPPLGHC